MKDEELMLYMSIVDEAVSVVLLVERYMKQIPIHYVSRSLQGAEINYALMEKLALALVHATRRLRSLLTQASDEELEELMKDQLLPADASPIALSPDYISDSDPEEDDEEDPEEDPADYPANGGDNDDNESSDDDNDDDDVRG
ncbi:reverse transcriptase domain-containing protein [Tanacetum coccineum]